MEQVLYVTIGAILSIVGITFKLVLDRMDTQEKRAALDISTLRAEIVTTKADANNAVNNATNASNTAAAATAVALRESVATTALAAKENVAASASALREQVASTAAAAKDSIAEKAGALHAKIDALDKRVERFELRELERSAVKK